MTESKARQPIPYPVPTSSGVTAVMRGNRRSNTRPELAVRSALHSRGYRYRVDHLIALEALRVRPDIVFTRQKIAIFLDGCFWHCCPEHGNRPRRNTRYWTAKLERNVARDKRVTSALIAAGWEVIRIWEHVPAPDAVAEIEAVLQQRGALERA
jgi:DNA mismatch endonuclease (patch repair protein)